MKLLKDQADCYEIEGDDRVPNVLYDYENSLVRITGTSMPENALNIYNPLLDKVSVFEKLNRSVDIHLQLDFFNSMSSKFLYMLLKKFQASVGVVHGMNVIWSMDEDDENAADFIQTIKEELNIEVQIKTLS